MYQVPAIARLIDAVRSPDWIGRAACGHLDVDQIELFFVGAGRTISKETAALCRSCPVRTECLDYAIDAEIAGGYFGGMSPSKRREVAAARGR